MDTPSVRWKPEIQPVTGSSRIQSKLLLLSQPCIRALSQIKGMISFSWVISLQGEMTNPRSVPPYGGGW